MKITAKAQDTSLWGYWDGQGGGLPWSASFQAPQALGGPVLPGDGTPNLLVPSSLPKVPPQPSRSVVTTVTGCQVTVGGLDLSAYLTSMDVMRPIHGEIQGVLTFQAWGASLDPSQGILAGSQVTVNLQPVGASLAVLDGFVTEPPRYRVLDGGIGELELRVGDILALKRMSEAGRLEPYCGPLPQTTAQAAQIFMRTRGLSGVFGGDALVEGLNPDFVDGPPWDFLASLYEPLNYDVRVVDGQPMAIPRPAFSPDRAVVLEAWQCLEASLDTPQALPFSRVTGYSRFNRNLGYRSQDTTSQDFSRWNPDDTRPWFESNNTYQVIKETKFGDTVVTKIVETWGYLPNSTLIPSGTTASKPCGNPPLAPVVTTRLDIIDTLTTRVYFEPHLSGSQLIIGLEETLNGWSTYPVETGTQLYFGRLQARRETYSHTPQVDGRVCPQYWAITRTASEVVEYARVSQETGEPEFRLTQKSTEAWELSEETGGEGQSREWVARKSSQTWADGRWQGGNQPLAGQPPGGQFIGPLYAPVSLEIEVTFPELASLFGDRESKPVNFPMAFTSKALGTAIDRYTREAAGLGYGLHLVVDPRVPLRPGQSVIYQRPGHPGVHGLVWSLEYNLTGPQLTQSVILMRTFTEPGLAAIRDNPGFISGATVDNTNPCL